MIQIKFAFFMAIGVILCCCISACITGGPPRENQSTGIPIGVNDKTPCNTELKVYLEDAISDPSLYNLLGINNISELDLHFIHGTAVDLDGKASRWVLATQRLNESSLVIYSYQGGWNQLSWGSFFTEPELTLPTIVMPRELFRKNYPIIKNASSQTGALECQVDLSYNRYSVAFNPGTSSMTLFFNASTGELVASV